MTLPLLGICMMTAGCHDWYAVRPTELPKINQSSSHTIPGERHSTAPPIPALVRSEIEMETPEGGTVTIEGFSNARLTIDGQVVGFPHPVRAAIDGARLTISSRDEEPRQFLLDQVELAEVSEFSYTKTFFLLMGIFALAGLAGGITYLILTH